MAHKSHLSLSGAAPDNATPDIAQLSQHTGALQALHGDIAQSSRESILRNFRADKFSVLVATDVAARGLDIPSVELVVHYDLPDQVGPAVLCCGWFVVQKPGWLSGHVDNCGMDLLPQLVVRYDVSEVAAILLLAGSVNLTIREDESGMYL